MSDRPESSQEIRCLHVEVTVDWKELLSSQSSKQLTDGGLSTSGEGAGAHTKHMTLDIYVLKKKTYMHSKHEDMTLTNLYIMGLL